MKLLGLILLFAFIGSVGSLAGGVLLLAREGLAKRFSRYLAPFAAGTLLGTAFFDLLPEASRENTVAAHAWALAGLLAFFLLERFVIWFHHHHDETGREEHVEPAVPLIVFGDTLHNFIDGVVIAATFLVDVKLGIITSLAVAAHEIPQEVGDFSLMLHCGVSRARVLVYNLLSSCATLVAATATWLAGPEIARLLPLFLALTAGFFIYIASSDIIPQIHLAHRRGFALVESTLILIGVAVVWVSLLVFG